METPKDDEPPTPTQPPTPLGGCYEQECDSSCSTLDPQSSQEEASFPFKLTPSGNFKVNSNQVVFQSSTLGVLLADPDQAKVKVKLESKGSSKESHLLKSDSTVKKYSKTIANHFSKANYKKAPSTKEEKGKELTSLGYILSGPSDWQKERLCALPDKEDLLAELYRRICYTIKTDTTVRILDEVISCHHIVLEVYSTYFAENLQRDIELPAKYVTAKAFQTAYNWMLCTADENKTISKENVLDLYSTAALLGIKSLEQQCWTFMENDTLFTEDTAFAMFLKAREKNLASIAEIMVPRIKLFFLPLVASKDFIGLSIEELIIILKSNEIFVTSEVEVLMAGIRWLFGDWQRRQKYIVEVMRCVRFGLISPWKLVDVKRNPENEEIFDIINEPEVQQMIDDGLAYVIVKYWYGNNTKEFRHWIEILGLTEPVERQWFGEEIKHVTYKDFLTYLQQFSLPKNEMMQKLEQMVNQKTNHLQGEIRGVNQEEMESRRQRYTPPSPPILAAEFLHQDHALPERGTTAAGGVLETIREMVPPESSSKKTTNEKVEKQTTHGKQLHQKLHNTVDNNLFYQPENFNLMEIPPTLQQVSKVFVEHSRESITDKDHRHIRPSSVPQNHDAKGEKLTLDVVMKPEAPERDGDNSSDNMEHIFKEALINSDAQKTAADCHRLSKAACYLASTIRQLGISSSKLSRNQEIITNAPEADTHRVVELPAISPEKLHETESMEPICSKALKKESFAIYNSKVSLKQVTPQASEKDFPKTVSQFSDHEREETPQISLFDYSKEDLAKQNLNKLSNSILAPSAKNYLSEGSLFNWDRETVIVFGGIDPHMPYGTNKNHGKGIYRFDPMFNVWENVGELPEPRHHHSVAFLRGRVYLVGGADPRDDDIRGKSVVVSTVWSFEPVTRSWYSESGLATPRKNFGLVVHKVALYAIGGMDKKGKVLRQVERFDPKAGMWKEVTPMRAPRMAVASIKYRDYIWVAGGMTGHKRNPLSRDVECYNSVTDEWTQIYSLRFPRCFASFFTMSDKLYLVGGAGKMSEKDKSASSVGAIDVWDWKHRVWKQETEMSIPRHGHAVAYLGTQIVIIGGVTTIYMRALSNVESYCCERNSWIRGVATIPLALSGHGAVTLPPASLM